MLVTARATYHLVARRRPPALRGATMPPTICFSDTHLVAHARRWTDDAPDDLVALLTALPTHQVLSLGDFAESIGVWPWQRRAIGSAPRLAPLMATLRARAATVVVGNHDDVDVLRDVLGPAAIVDGGLALADGRLRVRHGHEAAAWTTRLEHAVGPMAVPPFELMQRLRGSGGRKDNRRVRVAIGGGAAFVLFGHSHVAALDDDFANPGCFLHSAQSFLVLADDELALWRRTSHHAGPGRAATKTPR